MSLTLAGATAIAGGLAAAGQVASGVAQGKMNKKTREFNRVEAEKARNWSAQQENTAYQRSMKDMKAAGLNPMIMFGSGDAAGSGGGAQATVGNQEAPDVDVSGVVSSALETATFKRQARILDEQLASTQMDVYNKAKDLEVKDSVISANLANAGVGNENAWRLHYGRDEFTAKTDVSNLKWKTDRDKGFWAMDYVAEKLKNAELPAKMVAGGATSAGFLRWLYDKNRLNEDIEAGKPHGASGEWKHKGASGSW